jgi:rhodanese-related sulfurtransferase
MNRFIAAALASGLIAAGSACAEAPTAGTITGSDLAAQIAEGAAPVILDVRSEQEFASGHVPGALNVPHDEVADRLPELGLDPADEIVVYCESGRRAGNSEAELRRAGFTTVRHLEGDMRGWRASDLPCTGC